MVMELPDDSDFAAWVAASNPPSPEENEAVSEYRRRRMHRGWGLDRHLLARIGDGLTGHIYPRPGLESTERTETSLSDFGI